MERLRRPGGFQAYPAHPGRRHTCSTVRGREGTLNSKGSISQRGTYLSTSKKMALTFAGDLYHLFLFLEVGKKAYYKKSSSTDWLGKILWI